MYRKVYICYKLALNVMRVRESGRGLSLQQLTTTTDDNYYDDDTKGVLIYPVKCNTQSYVTMHSAQ